MSAPVAHAAWTQDGVQLFISGTAYPKNLAMVSDGLGGVILTWDHESNGTRDIFAQRIDDAGNVLWTSGGVVICNAVLTQEDPTIVSDGAGGAIIAWSDYRLSGGAFPDDIYAQRVNASGVVQWAGNGVQVCDAIGSKQFPQVVTDGAGGAIVAWVDFRLVGFFGTDIYAQRINSAGGLQWPTAGMVVCFHLEDQSINDESVVSDGAGGAIIAWTDFRFGPDADLYAQRIDGAGAKQWSPIFGSEGIALTLSPESEMLPRAISNGAGGAIFAWHDSAGNVASTELSSAGNSWFGPMPIGSGAGPRVGIASDGANGAIITWGDAAGTTIYAQRVQSIYGTPLWTAGGVAIHAPTGGLQVYPAIASDNAGGAIVAWTDIDASSRLSVAGRVSSNGALGWPTNGASISGADVKIFPHFRSIIPDGTGSTIHAWVYGDEGIQVQRINASGAWGNPGVFYVWRTADDTDLGSLRWAITLANSTPGPNVVAFNIPGAGPHTITPLFLLPTISDEIIIDGFTQPGASPNTTLMGSPIDAVYQVQVDGLPHSLSNGFVLQAPATLRGLKISGVGWGVIAQSTDVVIEGNYTFNCLNDGVLVTSSNGVRIGGPTPDARNILTGNQGSGIRLADGVDNPEIYGNYIGVGPDATTPAGNQYAGIHLQDLVSHAFIGTSALVEYPYPIEANIIAHNGQFGIVALDASCQKIVMVGNSIHDNGTLGIDLLGDGQTANDPGDVDFGPNELQNWPTITGALIDITGEMNGQAGSSFHVHFYRSAQCVGPGGKGDAAVFVGGMTVQTDGSGYAPFTFTPPNPLPAGSYITATATSASSRTSEISPCVLYQNTQSGFNVPVSLVDQYGIPQGTATFRYVGTPGNTDFTADRLPPVLLSGGFDAGAPADDPDIYFDISTDAEYEGDVEVCVSYDENDIPGLESQLQLVHYNGAYWEAVTTSVDEVNNTVCGRVTSLSPFVIAVSTATAIEDKPLPSEFALHANIPNPFNPQTTIHYEIPAAGADVNISIYDVAGRLVRELVDEHRAAGRWSVQWNGDDDRSQRVASGVYFYRMRAGAFVDTKKMVLLK
jgi:hypothetical protein